VVSKFLTNYATHYELGAKIKIDSSTTTTTLCLQSQLKGHKLKSYLTWTKYTMIFSFLSKDSRQTQQNKTTLTT